MKALRTFAPLALSIVASVFIAMNLTSLVHLPVKVVQTAPWGPFFTVFGVIYAIIAGFLLVDVLNRFSDLSQTVEAELNAVEDVRDFLIYVDGDQEAAKASIRKELQEFVRSVCDVEWRGMRSAHSTLNSDTSEELYDVMRAINELKVTNPSDSVALRSLIEKVSDITTLRTKRISLANEALPPRLKLLLAFMSCVLVGGFVLLSAKATILHGLMVGTVTFSVHLLYLIIMDLDTPFEGHWNISKASLEALTQTLEREEA